MAEPKVDITHVYRDWVGETAVRANLVDHGMLIISHKGPKELVKMCIKDCVRNMYALEPLLKRMAESCNALFTIKDTKQEPLNMTSVLFNFKDLEMDPTSDSFKV